MDIGSKRKKMSKSEREKMDAFCRESIGLDCIDDSSNDSDSWDCLSRKADQPLGGVECSDQSRRSVDEQKVEMLNALSI